MAIKMTEITPIKRTLMRDEVYELLLKWVVELRLEPGAKLRDGELADQLGVSRTPVREAIRRLEDQGFVETSAASWTRVARIDTNQARQLYPIIKTLEELALENVFDTIDESTLHRMATINDELRQAVSVANFLQASEADFRFHDAFINRCENHELKKLLSALKLKIRRIENAFFRDSSRAADSAGEHAKLVEALRKRNRSTAKSALARNWDESLKRLLVSG
jgi:DNA-binding GntR family transcriptional regulator